jgi:hypothetical protein
VVLRGARQEKMGVRSCGDDRWTGRAPFIGLEAGRGCSPAMEMSGSGGVFMAPVTGV